MPVVNAETPARGELTSPLGARAFPRLRDFGNYLLQIGSVSFFFVGGLGISICAPILRIALGRPRAMQIGRRAISVLFRFYVNSLQWLGLFRIRFEGCDRLKNLSGVIVTPNHPSLLDAVYLMSLVPRPIGIMRAGLKNNPCLAGAAGLAGFITNDRGAGLIRQCQAKLAAGDNLLIFPEGTRTLASARGVNPFKSGFALAAVLTGAPIQTVLIERNGPYLSKGEGLFSVAQVPIDIVIRPGDVFHALPGESARELAARMEDYFRTRLVSTGDSVRLRD
jgi:1-acyl-sn-glycerol-3-phosphate acyltransferase